jgi:hypothetical protein
MTSYIQIAEFDGIVFPVTEFINNVDHTFANIKSLPHYGKLARERGKNRDLKKFLEEILPLQKYMIYRIKNGMRAETIFWKNGSQKGDAILNGMDEIEITVAEHNNEYAVRESMNVDQPTFSADGTTKINGVLQSIPTSKSPGNRIQSHAEMIYRSISKKLAKYDRLNTLVVFLNQDGLLEPYEFDQSITMAVAHCEIKRIDNIFIWSFQFSKYLSNSTSKT